MDRKSLVILLSETPKCIANYLKRILPLFGDDWWNNAVLSKLTEQQRKWVRRRKIESLTQLDLAALLRVLDQNWYRISIKMDLYPEDRNFVKEMITVRNRWAHERSEEFSFDVIYRDLGTLELFSTVIEADSKFIKEIRSTKKYLLGQIKPNSQSQDKPEEQGNDKEVNPNRKFEVNCDRNRVERLCNDLISGKRGKTLGKDILKQLDKGYLNKSTYEMLSRWVNPRKIESFAQPIAAELSELLFGEEIKRIS